MIELTEGQRNSIDEIMDNFDFSRVKKTMDALEWEWVGIGIPTEGEIRSKARRMLKDCMMHRCGYLSTGGFTVEYKSYTSEISLRFEIEETDSIIK